MIELFNGSTAAQTEKHYSTVRTLIPVVNATIEADTDFVTCTIQCIPSLKLFTDEIGTDDYKNDWFTLYQNTVTGGTHTLAIVVNEVEIAITDDTYGQEYAGNNFYGYRFDAFDIWTQHGYGNYQAVMRAYDSNNNLIKETWSVCMTLQKFTDKTANGTVVIETQKKGVLRHGNKYYDLSMPGAVRNLPYWQQRVRLPGKLKRVELPVELMGVVKNDLAQTRLQSFDTMSEVYDLSINLVSSEQIVPVIFDDLFANVVMVTDYNVYNFESYRKVRLVRESISLQPRVVKRKSFTFRMVNEEKKFEKFNDSL